MAGAGDLSDIFPYVQGGHLIRFFIENLSLFCDQLPPDHGASLINA